MSFPVLASRQFVCKPTAKGLASIWEKMLKRQEEAAQVLYCIYSSSEVTNLED